MLILTTDMTDDTKAKLKEPHFRAIRQVFVVQESEIVYSRTMISILWISWLMLSIYHYLRGMLEKQFRNDNTLIL